MNRKVRNAVYIKCRNMFNSPAILLSALIIFILSSVISFQPLLKKSFFHENAVVVHTDIDFEQADGITFINDETENYDIKISFFDLGYHITVITKKGIEKLEIITGLIGKRNLALLSEKIAFTSDEADMMNNTNITIDSISEDVNLFHAVDFDLLMSFIMIFNILLMVLISRLSAQVAYEKGSMVTEIILTSISKKQLYFAQVFSSIIVIITILLFTFIPFIIAGMIHDPQYVMQISGLSWEKWIFILIHIILITISLTTAGIGLSSMASKAEDSNIYSFVVLLPLFVSFVYFIFEMDIYRGSLYLMNFIPLFSAFPILGSIMNGYLSNQYIMLCCMIEFVFIFIENKFTQKMYCKKIMMK